MSALTQLNLLSSTLEEQVMGFELLVQILDYSNLPHHSLHFFKHSKHFEGLKYRTDGALS